MSYTRTLEPAAHALEADDYLRRCIPWYQWRRRRRATALVASMAELATQPSLLALVPELAVAERPIRELFELHEFRVERWLNSERATIDPETLRAASEKWAVAVRLRMAADDTDSIDADDAARAAGVDAATLQAWRPAARSLLQRDAAGRFTFIDQSALEFLFICAFMRGETRCLEVRWSDFMRRVFVSGANLVQTRHGEDAVRTLLDHNFAATGLFPLSQPHPEPKRLETSEILNATALPPSAGLGAGPAWDPTRYVLERHVDDSLYLCDRAADAIYFVPTDWRCVEAGTVDAESARLFLVTRGQADSLIASVNAHRRDNRSDWRLPTLDEIDLVFLLNQQRGFLARDQYVWSADHTAGGERLVARMHHSDDNLDARLNPIGVRKILAANAAPQGYFVSSMPTLGIRDRRGKFDATFPALLIRISRGAAETFSAAFDQPSR